MSSQIKGTEGLYSRNGSYVVDRYLAVGCLDP